jgi:hypothetical protein
MVWWMMGLIFFAMRFTWGIIPVACDNDMAEDKGVNIVVPVESVQGFTGVVGELKVIEYVVQSRGRRTTESCECLSL